MCEEQQNVEVNLYRLLDYVSKEAVQPQDFVFTGEKTPWEIQMNLEWVKRKLNLNYFKMAAPCLSKYLPFMPIQNISKFISLTELATPLSKSNVLGKQLGFDLSFKIEAKNPTGSFKDRGSAVEISVAKELGAKAVILASTGNMAASCACYAAAAKIPCFVLVPEGVPLAKLAQVNAFGGHIIEVKGHYNDAAELAKKIAKKKGFYLAGDYAYRVEGQKTAAFEMIDQLLFQTPDFVVVPIGCGTNLAAYWKGFYEYYQLGLIEKIPKLVGVQAQGASAVVDSYKKDLKTITALERVDTVASAIAVANPIDGVKALDAIYATGGFAVAVSDQEILQAQYLLSTKESLFVESASAATVAALLKTAKESVYANKKVVCVLTGDGLKDSNVVFQETGRPLSMQPGETDFMMFDDHSFSVNHRRFS